MEEQGRREGRMSREGRVGAEVVGTSLAGTLGMCEPGGGARVQLRREADMASDWACDGQVGWNDENGEDSSFQNRRRGIDCHCSGTPGG